jgi:hypothetical protein
MHKVNIPTRILIIKNLMSFLLIALIRIHQTGLFFHLLSPAIRYTNKLLT